MENFSTEKLKRVKGGRKVKAKNKAAAAAKRKSSKSRKVAKVNRDKVIAPKKANAQEAAKVKSGSIFDSIRASNFNSKSNLMHFPKCQDAKVERSR